MLPAPAAPREWKPHAPPRLVKTRVHGTGRAVQGQHMMGQSMRGRSAASAGRRRRGLLLLGFATACAAEPLAAPGLVDQTASRPAAPGRAFGHAGSFLDAGAPAATSPDPAVAKTLPDAAAAPPPEPRIIVDDAGAAAEAVERPPADDDPALDLERSLRAALASSSDPSGPALELMGLLCSCERYPDALAVAVEAQSRSNSPALRVAKAGVLRDLGRRHLAVAELRSLLQDHGAAGMHPSLLFELAEIEWLEGDPDASKQVLATIEAVHAGDAWCIEHRKSLEALADEMQHGASPTRVRVRDLLGNLRGAPSAMVRLRVLEQLSAATLDGDQAASDDLHARAIAAACADESPSVRARAVQLAPFDGPTGEQFCATALDDPDALVRCCAAARAPEWLGAAGVPILLDHLAGEKDAAAFAALHGALAKLVPNAPALPSSSLDLACVRARIVQAWRQQCGL